MSRWPSGVHLQQLLHAQRTELRVVGVGDLVLVVDRVLINQVPVRVRNFVRYLVQDVDIALSLIIVKREGNCISVLSFHAIEFKLVLVIICFKVIPLIRLDCHASNWLIISSWLRILRHFTFQILINLEGHGRQVGGIGCQRNTVPQLPSADRHCILQGIDEGSAFQKRDVITNQHQDFVTVRVHLITWQLHNLSILVVFYGQVRLSTVVFKLRRGVVEVRWIVDSQTLHCVVDVFVAICVILWQVREGANPVIFIRLFLCLCSVFSTVFGNGQRLLIPAVIRIKLHFPTALCCLVKGQIEVGALAMLQGVLVVPFFVELDFLRPGELVGDGDFLLVVLLLLILLLVGVFPIGDAQIAQQGLEVVAGALWKMIVQKIL